MKTLAFLFLHAGVVTTCVRGECRVTLVQQLSKFAMCVPEVTFGCYPAQGVMWAKGGCRGFFRCRGSVAATKCGSTGGAATANCTCGVASGTGGADALARARQKAHGCGVARVGSVADHVSNHFRRLPQPPKVDPSVKCCRNKPSNGGAIDWNSTISFTGKGTFSPHQTHAAHCPHHAPENTTSNVMGTHPI